jgi:hypothetical protein
MEMEELERRMAGEIRVELHTKIMYRWRKRAVLNLIP